MVVKTKMIYYFVGITFALSFIFVIYHFFEWRFSWSDLSTNLDAPLEYQELKKKDEKERIAFLREKKDLFHRSFLGLGGRVVPGSVEEVMTRLKGLIQKCTNYRLVREDRERSEIELLAKLGWFLFNDEVVLRFEPRRLATVVEVRARSRWIKTHLRYRWATIVRILKHLENFQDCN